MLFEDERSGNFKNLLPEIFFMKKKREAFIFLEMKRTCCVTNYKINL